MNTKIQYYTQKYDAKNNSYQFTTKASGVTDLKTILEIIKNPKPSIKKLVDEIRATKDKQLKRKLKSQLTGFTVQSYNDGKRRAYDNITHFTGLIVLDFDGADVKENAHELKQFLFDSFDFILASFISPSGAVKCIMRIPVAKDLKEFKECHRAVDKIFNSFKGWDDTTKNAVLIMYYTYDENILIRENASVFSERIAEDRQPIIDYSESLQKYSSINEKRALAYVESIFNGINDNGHPQVIRLSSKLGSFASYYGLNTSDMVYWMNHQIKQHPYLIKDVRGYQATADRFFKEGYMHPQPLPS